MFHLFITSHPPIHTVSYCSLLPLLRCPSLVLSLSHSIHFLPHILSSVSFSLSVCLTSSTLLCCLKLRPGLQYVNGPVLQVKSKVLWLSFIHYTASLTQLCCERSWFTFTTTVTVLFAFKKETHAKLLAGIANCSQQCTNHHTKMILVCMKYRQQFHQRQYCLLSVLPILIFLPGK